MGFDFDRSEMNTDPDTGTDSDTGSVRELMEHLLEENLVAERAAIDSYRRIAANGKPQDEAALRLVRVVLAVEEEHAEILSTVRDTLRDLKMPV
jgi:bacterioferritin